MALLEVKNLHARVAAPGGREILKGVDLAIDTGQVHAIMPMALRNSVRHPQNLL